VQFQNYLLFPFSSLENQKLQGLLKKQIAYEQTEERKEYREEYFTETYSQDSILCEKDFYLLLNDELVQQVYIKDLLILICKENNLTEEDLSIFEKLVNLLFL